MLERRVASIDRTAALLIACAEHDLVLVAFDRRTLPWQAGESIRAGEAHGGLILFRRSVRSTDYGYRARLLTGLWAEEGAHWDWQNRIVYLPKPPRAAHRERLADPSDDC